MIPHGASRRILRPDGAQSNRGALQGDVGHPEPIRPGRREVAADQIGRRRGGGIPARGALGLPAAHALHAVRAALSLMNHLNLGAHGDVRPGGWSGRSARTVRRATPGCGPCVPNQ